MFSASGASASRNGYIRRELSVRREFCFSFIMQIIRFRRSKPAGRNRFVFFSVCRPSGKRESLSRQPERLCPAALQKAPPRRRAGRFHAVPNGSGAAFFAGRADAHRVFLRTRQCSAADVCTRRPNGLLSCPSAGPHCYYNTSGALCHHLKLFFCKNLCARPMGNFTKTTLHKIICMLQSNR